MAYGNILTNIVCYHLSSPLSESSTFLFLLNNEGSLFYFILFYDMLLFNLMNNDNVDIGAIIIKFCQHVIDHANAGLVP